MKKKSVKIEVVCPKCKSKKVDSFDSTEGDDGELIDIWKCESCSQLFDFTIPSNAEKLKGVFTYIFTFTERKDEDDF